VTIGACSSHVGAPVIPVPVTFPLDDATRAKVPFESGTKLRNSSIPDVPSDIELCHCDEVMLKIAKKPSFDPSETCCSVPKEIELSKYPDTPTTCSSIHFTFQQKSFDCPPTVVCQYPDVEDQPKRSMSIDPLDWTDVAPSFELENVPENTAHPAICPESVSIDVTYD